MTSMGEGLKRRRTIGQWVAMLVAGMLLASVIITPVGAHITTFSHLKTKHFYTKKAADARFINTSDVAAAQVRFDGVMLGSVPPGATSTRLALGEYDVVFQRSVAGCVISSALVLHVGETTVWVHPTNPNALRVYTANSDGALTDRWFAVQMICP